MTKTFGLFGAVTVLTAAMALSGCGGGGGSGGGFGPGGQGISVKQPGLTAGGVTADISYGTQPVIRISKGSTPWTVTPDPVLAAPSGWTGATKLSPGSFTHRFHAVTNIDSAADQDYLAYGYWSKHRPDTMAASGFQSFFYGSMPYEGNIAALPTTQVTYTGGAAGVYKVLDDESGAPYGHFRADFSLTASFGPGARVNGSITNISRLDDGGAQFNFGDINNLILHLSGNGFAGSGPTGGSRWGGRFFGPSGAAPTGVAGWFENLTSSSASQNFPGQASLSGSFGAKR